MKFVAAPLLIAAGVVMSVVLGLAAVVSSLAATPAPAARPSTAGPTTPIGLSDPATDIVESAAVGEEVPRPTAPVPSSETVIVGGFRVHLSLAADLRDLLDAAEADGIEFGGWGWRDHQAQIRLRRQHCGKTEYAIWRMPSSQCSPPTARPGRSQHERGLAIDFTYNGRTIGSRRSAAFIWLDTNAERFGLFNLPSEPWHWSTTGR